MHRIPAGAAIATCLALALPAAAQQQQPNREAMIRSALSAAPPTMRDTVRVTDMEGNVLRDGPPGFTCLPAPQGIAGPMCVDEVFLGWVQAWSKREPPRITRAAFAYMLAGDSPNGGASNTDPFAPQPTAGNDWMVEGPHVMVIVPDPAALEGIGTDHRHGGAYVMWRGTPWAHVMMPVGPRPAQRDVAGR